MHWIVPSERDAATDTLEKRLWAAAEQARPAPNTGLNVQEYFGGSPQGRVLGLIFLRYVEVRFAAQRAQLESPSPLGGERAGWAVKPTRVTHPRNSSSTASGKPTKPDASSS